LSDPPDPAAPLAGLLQGCVCAVTGGARGIGRAICERFAEEGAKLLVGDVLDDDGEAVAEATGGVYVHIDVTSRSSLERALATAVAEFGHVDVLVANAGVLLQEHVLDMDETVWQRTLDVNLTGVFQTCQVFGRHMRDRGAGRIVITSSIGGQRSGPFYGAYSASKFGVIGLARALAREVAEHGILVNCVCPGSVDTPMMEDLVEVQSTKTGRDVTELIAEHRGAIPLGRYASPAEVADVFVFLASPLARFVTGQTVVVDGGSLA
jgi:NAD(P)-dependent dehydrogenase (short-subunit alcohol dehydrogenase family)